MDEPKRKSVWRWLTPLIKGVATAALVGYLWNEGRLDFSALLVMTAAPWLMTALVGLSLLAYSLTAVRWMLLLRSQEIHLPFSWAHRVTYIGLFFNLFLPGGGMAGDALRMAYAVRAAPSHRPEAVLSLFVDRVVGLYAMLLICLLAVFGNPALAAGEGPLRVMILVVAGLVCGAPVMALLVYLGSRRITRWLGDGPHPGRMARLVTRLVDILFLYRHAWPTLLLSCGISLLAQVLNIVSLVQIARIMALGSLTPNEIAFATPWAWMANFIPLTPGGIGVGEAAFDQVCHWIESTPTVAAYGTIFLVFRLTNVLATLPGLGAYLFFRQDVLAVIKRHPALAGD